MAAYLYLVMFVTWLAVVSAQTWPLLPRCVSPNCSDDPLAGIKASDIFLFELYGKYNVYVKFKANVHFIVVCKHKKGENFLSADDPAMPALPWEVTVDTASFDRCGTPAGPYVDVLQKLNVTVTKKLELVLLPNGRPLADTHLAGLTLNSLDVQSHIRENNVNLAGSSLFKFLNKSDIRNLSLTNVILNPEDLLMFPDTLEILSIIDIAFLKEPNSNHWLERLHSLTSLKVVQLDVRLKLLLLSKLPKLTEAIFLNTPLELPHNWLNGSAINKLTLSHGSLQKLPEYMFGGVNLTELRLSQNDLTELPKDITSLNNLRLLDVSRNNLRGAGLWRAVASLPALEVLQASHNPLGAACPEDEGLSMPRSLQNLILTETFAARVCGAWRQLPALKSVGLSSNNITAVSYKELKGAARGLQVDLSDNPRLRAVSVEPSDLDGCRREKQDGSLTDLRLSLSALRCDCSNALFREMLTACVSLSGDVACAARPRARSFLRHRPGELVCRCPEDYTVPGCSCKKLHNATLVQCSSEVPKHAHWPPTNSSQPLVLLVPDAGLQAVPTIPLIELYAANNSISDLHAEDIKDSLKKLDLRNNNISHLSVETVKRLGESGRRVWLGGNPLACDCADRESIELLLSPKVRENIVDWQDLRCSDGRELIPSKLCYNWPWTIIGVACTVLILAIWLTIAWHRTRLRFVIKRFLFHNQLCVDWVLRPKDSTTDPKKDRSSFVSYAHGDHSIAKKLIERLEQRGYTTVEHSRDWVPGVPIDEQIEESILRSRRVILLVTDRYARSERGLQEFRQAHAHALQTGAARVVPVLCGLSSPELLPEVLRLYLRNNTYLTWDDEDFLAKLWRVMPPVPVPPPPHADDVIEQVRMTPVPVR